MMTCAEIAELARQHTEGALPMRVRVHLAMCKHCRRYLRQLRATVAMLGALRDGDGEPGPDAPLLDAFRNRPRDDS